VSEAPAAADREALKMQRLMEMFKKKEAEEERKRNRRMQKEMSKKSPVP